MQVRIFYVYLKKAPGTKNHSYVGSLHEDGFHSAKHRTHASSKESLPRTIQPEKQYSVSESPGMQCFEFGFSKGMLDMCPEEWKKAVGEYWKPTLYERKRYHGTSAVLLNLKLPTTIPTLYETLGNIYVMISDEQRTISVLNQAQRDFCTKYNIHLEVM